MKREFENWLPLRDLRVGDLPKCGTCSAVYALRDHRNLEVIKDTLRRRIFGNFIGGVGGANEKSTTQRIHIELFYAGMIDHVDIAWIVTKDKATAKLMEGQLRESYKAMHDGRRPIWDRNG